MFNGNYYTDYASAVSRNNYLNDYLYYKNNKINAISSIRKINSKDNIIKDSQTQKKSTFSKNLKNFKDYMEKSENFFKEFNDKFSELKKSSKKLQEYSNSSEFVKNNINTSDEEYENAVINAVKDFASDYNNAVSFLDANESVSKEVKSLSNSYKSIKYNCDKLNEIGINVDYKTGLLSINEGKLTGSVKTDIKKVLSILGDSSKSIAAKIYNKTELAINNSREFYPNAQLETNHINNTYFYNPNNRSIIQSNIAYSTGLLLNYLI